MAEVTLRWADFSPFIHQEMAEYRFFVYRGQCDAEWTLCPTIDRSRSGFKDIAALEKHQLETFKFASRGRRGVNPPQLSHPNEWWALGRHYGLVTPLLDWSASPFVAAYFAFVEPQPEGTRECAVFALHHRVVERRSASLEDDKKVVFVRPQSDENPRLVSQGGLFTRGPSGVTLESWVSEQFDSPEKGYVLIKITMPRAERSEALRDLNRMNINHLTLFPDLTGSASFCNLALDVEKY